MLTADPPAASHSHTCLPGSFPSPQVLSKFKGEALKGLSYQPLFPYFEHLREGGAFRVVADAYVTADSGVGIVHQAPAFGECGAAERGLHGHVDALVGEWRRAC